MDSATINHISLCAGYGGIDLGLSRAMGGSLRTIAYSEIEAFACANLVAKMEAGLLDPAPVWSDLRTFPWKEFHGLVDVISGGYPCQPFSAAGKQAGRHDPRHLWPWIADGIAICRPGLVFLENVEGHIALGLRDVIEDLGRMGYRSTWGVFSAREVGACHQRKRVFILAHSMCERGLLPSEWELTAKQDSGGDGTARRTEDGWVCIRCDQDIFGGCGCYHGESQCAQCGEWTYPFYYGLTQDGCSNCGRGFPNWSDYTQWPVEPCVRRGNDGPPNRVDRLRLLGNGVVPACAEKAFQVLLAELFPETQSKETT